MSDPQTAAPPLAITPSERVLLFGDRFSKPAGMLGYGEVVLSSGNKVDAEGLATSLMAAAFLANEQAGAIRLELRPGKAMFGLMKTEHLHAVPGQRQVGWPEGSLERVISISVQNAPKVDDLVSGILQQRSQSPAQTICSRVKAGLAARGVLAAEEKKTLKIFTSVTYSLPDHARRAAEQGGTAHVEQMLNATQHQRPQIWAQLTRNIKSAITAMTESSD
ncbi:hypothetical protein [Longimicrobium sp.]|uniref:hypothetical protein n=1 Tax=Longimicrobium sp. TaxID=2029185 RepID=UPI002CDB02EA|nr:hypothetical protein [Longimicrobium sp.]HSU13852.1 hypothetical protein [Longimicrobium sp.]